jgi:hypothetical protein
MEGISQSSSHSSRQAWPLPSIVNLTGSDNFLQLLHCNIAAATYMDAAGARSMSNQLTISAVFSVLAMAAFALASPHIAAHADHAGSASGFAREPAVVQMPGKAPALPGLADFIH